MFYIIRFVLCNLLLTLPTIYILIKLKKKFANSKTNTNAAYTRTAKKPIEIKKQYYFHWILIVLLFFLLFQVFSYPFEKYFVTFSSEKSAFAYICKDVSKYERFECDNAIFYVERSERQDKIYSITKIGDRYSYVISLQSGDKYQELQCKNAEFDVTVMYNESANVSFYDVVVCNQPTPDNHTATLNDNELTYATTVNKVWFNGQRKAVCYYYMDKAKPIKDITVEAPYSKATLAKPRVKHWWFITYADLSNSDD